MKSSSIELEVNVISSSSRICKKWWTLHQKIPPSHIKELFFFSFLKTRTAPGTQGMYYRCNTIKIPNYNGQSKQEEKNINKYVKLSSTRAKNERKKRLNLKNRTFTALKTNSISFQPYIPHYAMRHNNTQTSK